MHMYFLKKESHNELDHNAKIVSKFRKFVPWLLAFLTIAIMSQELTLELVAD